MWVFIPKAIVWVFVSWRWQSWKCSWFCRLIEGNICKNWKYVVCGIVQNPWHPVFPAIELDATVGEVGKSWKEGCDNYSEWSNYCCLSESQQFSSTKLFWILNFEFHTNALVISFFHIVYFWYSKKLRGELKIIDVIIQKSSRTQKSRYKWYWYKYYWKLTWQWCSSNNFVSRILL